MNAFDRNRPSRRQRQRNAEAAIGQLEIAHLQPPAPPRGLSAVAAAAPSELGVDLIRTPMTESSPITENRVVDDDQVVDGDNAPHDPPATTGRTAAPAEAERPGPGPGGEHQSDPWLWPFESLFDDVAEPGEAGVATDGHRRLGRRARRSAGAEFDG